MHRMYVALAACAAGLLLLASTARADPVSEPAAAQTDGATVTHFSDCTPTAIFVGGQAFYNVTFCIEGINVYNFTGSSSGNQSYVGQSRLHLSYSGDCEGDATDASGSHALIMSPEEGPFESHLRARYHATLSCGNGAVVADCDIEQQFQMANGEIIFSRDETVCT